MIIKSIAFRAPSLRVTNDWIVEQIREYNCATPRDQLERYCRRISKLLAKCGAETRFIRDRAGGERAFDILMDVARAALVDARVDAAQLDLIVFCGVGRGFIEPANGAFVADALDATCDSFDISEGCMSWVRAMQVVYNFLQSGAYRTALIVNAEFTIFERGVPGVFEIRDDEQIRYAFPALTIGEGASATVLVSSDRRWSFRFRSVPRLASLCTLPLPGYEDFCRGDGRIGLNGPGGFVAFAQELAGAAKREMAALITESGISPQAIDLWIPHMTGEPDFDDIAQRLGVGSKLYTRTFRQYGNLISASIPAAIWHATREGQLTRGQRIALCPAAAGMVFALVDGVY